MLGKGLTLARMSQIKRVKHFALAGKSKSVEVSSTSYSRELSAYREVGFKVNESGAEHSRFFSKVFEKEQKRSVAPKPAMPSWGYTKDNGPHTWANVAPAAHGKRQSPIDIIPSACQFDESLNEPAFRWSYTPHHAQTLVNNGHSAQVTYDSAGSSLEGGPLSGKYKIAQFHLHWGQTDDKGSEHRIDGRMFAAELHIVHWNADKYASFGEAADKSDGLCVLAVFIEGGASQDHLGLKKMTDLLKEVPNKGDSISFPGGFDPLCVLPNDTNCYWTYLGSLTTPPLYESVTWVVFKEPIKVSDEQMAAFRALDQCCKNEPAVKDEFGGKIVDNFRPPQPLEGRVARASFQ